MGWRVGGPGFCMCTCLCRGCASREAARARARARALTEAAQHGGVGGPGPDSQVAHVDDRAAWGWWGGWVGRCGGECVCVHGVGCLPACRAGVGAGGRAHPQAPPSHPRNMALTSRCCQWRRRRRRVPPSGAQTLCVGRGGKEGGERQAGGQRGGAAGEGGCAGASVAGKGGGCASLTPCAAVLFSLLWPPRQRAQLRQAQHSGSHAQVAVHLRVWCVGGWVRRQRGARATRPGASASVCRRATPPALARPPAHPSRCPRTHRVGRGPGASDGKAQPKASERDGQTQNLHHPAWGGGGSSGVEGREARTIARPTNHPPTHKRDHAARLCTRNQRPLTSLKERAVAMPHGMSTPHPTAISQPWICGASGGEGGGVSMGVVWDQGPCRSELQLQLCMRAGAQERCLDGRPAFAPPPPHCTNRRARTFSYCTLGWEATATSVAAPALRSRVLEP